MMAINQTAAQACSAEVDFGGTATPVAYQEFLWNSTADTFNAVTTITTSFASPLASAASIAHYIWEFEGLFVVTVSGVLTLAATCASGAKTADAGGYIVCEKWA